ncbi:MAG TPA: hypothetical protein CFH81_07460 [Sulfurovum sp. UBA12169]|nr:MAG TPA: hypothetical protein CFH81_07460 [Sulfurovum sp. UBA12169]
MKKIVLSAVAIAMMATAATASTSSELKELKAQMAAMAEKIAQLEAKQVKATEAIEVQKVENASQLTSKSPVIELSGKHYLGFVSDNADDTNEFETRRNYLQVKGFFEDNPKNYFRITLDTFQNTGETDAEDGDSWEVRLKYAYLYLDNVLPYTGVEIGQSHRPWIDYEEHGGWNYRSISKVFVEADEGAHLTNSADLGVNFKTKMPHFSSELGLFNGEGYHDLENGDGLSAEWRLTGHLLGTGKEKRKDDMTYADISFFGQWNDESNKHKNEDLNWYGMHAVYNQPEFLVAAQYVSTEDANAKYAGDGWSVNGEFRLATLSKSMKDYGIIGRYDSWDLDNYTEKERRRTIAGLTYQYNKYVEFIANYMNEEIDGTDETDAFMLTTEVNW